MQALLQRTSIRSTPVATVVNGELTLHDPDKYAEIMDPADSSPGDIGDQKIDDETIRQLTARMPPAIAAVACEALKKYAGMSWSAALQAHSELK